MAVDKYYCHCILLKTVIQYSSKLSPSYKRRTVLLSGNEKIKIGKDIFEVAKKMAFFINQPISTIR